MRIKYLFSYSFSISIKIKRGCPKSPVCHPERSEGSPESRYWREILRSAQKDNNRKKNFLDSLFLLFLPAVIHSFFTERDAASYIGVSTVGITRGFRHQVVGTDEDRT